LVLLGTDEEELMRRGNLSLVSANYLVLPVIPSDDSAEVTGVRVVPRD
jgi:predicted CoA-binding protein